MTATSFSTLGALVVLAGAGLYEWRVASRQTDELHSLQTRLTAETNTLAELRAAHATVEQDIINAEQQLDALSAASNSDPAVADRQQETNAWLQRLKQLRQIAASEPARCIPEMALLTDSDWLRAAQWASVDDDHGKRLAFADLRTRAIQKFSIPLQSALRRYAKAQGEEAPPSILSLASYFDSPVDPAMLRRYEIFKGSLPSNQNDVRLVVREARPIDAIYDSRRQISSGGGGYSASAPFAWAPDYRERYSQATRAYADAHHGARPPDLAKTLPYFDPPLDPAIVEYVLRTKR